MFVIETACTVIQYGASLTFNPSSISFFNFGRSWITFSTGNKAVEALVTSSTARRMIRAAKSVPTVFTTSWHLLPSIAAGGAPEVSRRRPARPPIQRAGPDAHGAHGHQLAAPVHARDAPAADPAQPR